MCSKFLRQKILFKSGVYGTAKNSEGRSSDYELLFTEDVGGILTFGFEPDGTLTLNVTADEGDLLFDDIGSELKIKEIQRTRQALLESLETYYRVFFLGEKLEEE